MARAYYNEFDHAAAHILRALIDDGVLAPGDVDTRSIKEVMPDDLDGYTQCHFFAGGGLWSVAARLAGWPDDRPLWTGSCPCQPFSAAGKGLGTDDPRHLWPDFHRLIRARRPAVVMGEQVAGAAGYGWFDGVRFDLESEGYASRAVDFPACSVDAPHQRNRLYWIAVEHAASQRRGKGLAQPEFRGGWPTPAGANASIHMACGEGERGRERASAQRGQQEQPQSGVRNGECPACGGSGRVGPFFPGGMSTICANCTSPGVTLGDAFGTRLEGQRWHGDGVGRPEQGRPVAAPDGSAATSDVGDDVSGGCAGSGLPNERRSQVLVAAGSDGRATVRSDRRNGTYWSDAEWLLCHDGKARRAEPSIRLLVDGLPGRVDLWRVGGNAIVPEAAAEVIAAYLDTERAAA